MMPKLQLPCWPTAAVHVAVFMAVISSTVLFGQTEGVPAIIKNLKEVTRNSTHVTFSWDVENVYIGTVSSSSSTASFRIFAKYITPQSSTYYHSDNYLSTSIRIGDAILHNNNFRTFLYTMPLTQFNYYEYSYLLWVDYYTRATSSYIYSEQMVTRLGLYLPMEMKIKLKSGQTCDKFQTITSTYDISGQVYRALRIHCRCTYPYIDAMRLECARLNCAPSDYVTYRAHITSRSLSYHPVLLNDTLIHWRNNPSIDNITIRDSTYKVEPGDCGIFIENAYVPYCSNSSSEEDVITDMSAALNSATGSTQPVMSSDNTAVIIASVFATLFFILTLGLIGLALAILWKRKFKKSSYQEQSGSHDGGMLAITNRLAQEAPYSDPTPNPYLQSRPSAGSTLTTSTTCARTRQAPIYKSPLPNPEMPQEVYEPLRV